MTSLNATHVTLHVQNFMFQTMVIITEVTELKYAQRRFSDKQCKRQRWQLTVEIGRFRFWEKTRLNVRVRVAYVWGVVDQFEELV